MGSEIEMKNTLAFQFPENAAQPTIEDMARFVKDLKGDRSMMDTAYKISDEKAVFIRFKCESAMTFALQNNSSVLPFYYTSGKKVMLHMSVAGGHTRYVRVFDLPPEVVDSELTSVLAKYGTVKRVVRERFPADSGLNMFSGIRGVYMDIKNEIPECLTFCGRKGRLYFEGMKLKCYVCQSDAHLKKACPNLVSQQGKKVNNQHAKQQRTKATKPERADTQSKATDESAAAGAASMSEITRKRQNKDDEMAKKTEKRQLSIDSADSNCQPDGKKKTAANDDNDDGSVISVSDDLQNNCSHIGDKEVKEGSDSESESDLELLDFSSATTETIQAWNEKRERMSRKQAKKIERLLSKHK